MSPLSDRVIPTAPAGRLATGQPVSDKTHTLMHQSLTLAARSGHRQIPCEVCGQMSGAMVEPTTADAEGILQIMADAEPEPEYARPVQPHRRQLYPPLPNHWADKTWFTWAFDSVNRDAVTRAEAWLETLRGTLVLFGSTGTGKTHVLAAIAHELVERHVDISPWEWDDWTSTLRGVFDGNDHTEIAAFEHRMLHCGVLILDDVRAESTGQAVREMFEKIVHKRTQEGKPIMLTTNADPDEWRAWSNRAYSRLRAVGHSEWVAMVWEDRRLAPMDTV